jgi:hypothetical protein
MQYYTMSKLIRVKDHTFDELAKHAKWSDTMDMIISRLMRERPYRSGDDMHDSTKK